MRRHTIERALAFLAGLALVALPRPWGAWAALLVGLWFLAGLLAGNTRGGSRR